MQCGGKEFAGGGLMASVVIRLSYEAIAAACCGDLNLATSEIIEDLPRLAARTGLQIAIAPAGSPCRCQTHKIWLIRDTKQHRWVCPALGCREYYADEAEEHSEAARVYHQEVAEKTRDAKRGGSEHRKKHEKPRKWAKFYPVE